MLEACSCPSEMTFRNTKASPSERVSSIELDALLRHLAGGNVRAPDDCVNVGTEARDIGVQRLDAHKMPLVVLF